MMRPDRLVPRLALVGLLGAVVVFFFPAAPASAHPLGNFTVNQHLGVGISSDHLEVTLVTDMAEIPAFQTRRDIDSDGDGAVSAQENVAWQDSACADRSGQVRITINGSRLPIEPAGVELTFPPGQGGLPTLRLTCRFEADAGGNPARSALVNRTLEIENANSAGRIGWREIVVAGRGVRLEESDVPAESPSDVLRRYPQDLLASPVDVTRATVITGGPDSSEEPVAGQSAPNKPGGPALPFGTDRLAGVWSDLVARQELTVWFGLLGVGAAVALGALHALAPGHGKTVMAAFLLGERGALRDAAVLGLSVTATHTAGVLVLGTLLSGSATLVPERLYPWLALVSGLLLAAVGFTLFRRALRSRALEGHGHHHGGHHHNHEHTHTPPAARVQPLRSRSVLALGAAGGLVPSPSALVVLLGAIALGRTWFGILLVLGYGVGMALTLMAAGLLLVRARNVLERRLSAGSRLAAAARVLPLATASVVVVVGVGLAGRAATRI